MSRVVTALREWVRPDSISRSFIPPMDGGLRANDVLDEAQVLDSAPDFDPEDVLIRADGTVIVASGATLLRLIDGTPAPLVTADGVITALVEWNGEVVVAVEGHGLVTVAQDGHATDLCCAPEVRTCVTDMAVIGSDILLTVGSATLTRDEWARALLADEHDGLIVRIESDGRSRIEAERLAWPAGIAVVGRDVLIALSTDYTIERRSNSDLSRDGTTLLTNLPVYPGRIRVNQDVLWVAAPYARNRMTEIFIEDAALVEALVDRIDPNEWPVPRLRLENPYRDLMQLGQLRVLGVLKPWAPPRSYGLVFTVDLSGLIRGSAHSRVDGRLHGVTGLALDGDRVILAVRGSRAIASLPREVLA